jgi:hypothetical protein
MSRTPNFIMLYRSPDKAPMCFNLEAVKAVYPDPEDNDTTMVTIAVGGQPMRFDVTASVEQIMELLRRSK